MKKIFSMIVIMVVMFVASVSMAAEKSTLDMTYTDFGFTTEAEKAEFVKTFTNSAIKASIIKIGNLENREVAEILLKDDQYWSDLRGLYTKLATEFVTSNMTLRQLSVKAFSEGLKEAEKLQLRLKFSKK